MHQVSVIIPAYGVTRYIAEALDSVFAQTFSDYEIVVINDGCPDTEALERVLAPYRDRITYLKQPNGGPSQARNAGIVASSAPFVAFLDGDDVWEPSYLERQLSFLRENPSIDAVYSDGVIIGDHPDAGRRLMDLSPSEGEVTFARLVTQECTVFLPLTARREAIVRAGMFTPQFRNVEDFDLWLRMLLSGAKFAYQRLPLFRYRRRKGSLSEDSVAMRRAAVQVLERFKVSPKITAAERSAIEKGEARFQAEIYLFEGMRAFEARDTVRAVENLRAANRQLHDRRLGLKVFLLRWCPELAYAGARLWRTSGRR